MVPPNHRTTLSQWTSALTATELTNPTNQDFDSGKLGKGGNAGKWSKTGGNGGKWGGIGGGGWGNDGHSTRDVACGVLWRDVVEENGRKMGGKWAKKGTKYSFFNPIFPICSEVEDIPHSSLCKNQLTALTDGKMGIFAIH